MSFEKDKYQVVKKAISDELASFCYAYFCNKRQVAKHLQDTRYISPFDDTWGTWKDKQIPNTYGHYADIVMETLLERVLPKMMKVTNLKLIPTYSYARIYKFGDILHRHKDRPSCEISCTLNLGGDEWPIYLDPTGEEGKEGKKVLLKPGDMLAYSGCDLEHWREDFTGKDCCQVFLHYNSTNDNVLEEPNLFDTRPMLGLPAEFAKNKK
jgi:hypothetical protein